MNDITTAAASIREALEATNAYDTDRASTRNGVGFSKMDGPTIRALLALESWTSKDLRRATDYAHRYRGQTDASIAVNWVRANVNIETRAIGHSGERFIARFDSGSKAVWIDLKDAVKNAGFRFDMDTKTWWTTDVRVVAELGWELSDRAKTALTTPSPGTTHTDTTAPQTETAPTEQSWFRVRNRHWETRFPYEIKDEFRAWTIQARIKTWWNATGKFWTGPDRDADKVSDWLIRKGVIAPTDIVEVETPQDELDMEELSGSLTCEPFNIPGLASNVALLPHQYVAVRYMELNKRTMLADELGAGKTLEVLATLAVTDSYPALIVCPAVLKANWQIEVERFFPNLTTQVLEGREGNLYKRDIYIANYDILAEREAQLARIDLKIIAFDESQFVKSKGAKRTKAARALAREVQAAGGRVVSCTSTPVMNKADELGAALALIDRLADIGMRSEGSVASTYGGASFERQAQLSVMLRRKGIMVRRLKKDLPLNLPPLTEQRINIQVPEAELTKYRLAEEELMSYVADRARAKALELGEDVRGAVVSATIKAQAAEALVRLAALRTEAAHAKLRHVIRWAENEISNGGKIVLFGVHRSVTEGLARHFGAPAIIGGMKDSDRTAAIKRFQTDPACRVIVCSIQAAGFGVTLTAANKIAIIELPWNPAARNQATGRIHRIGQVATECFAYDTVIPDTIDDHMSRIIAEKALLVDALTDGQIPDDDDMQSSVAGELMGIYLDKALNRARRDTHSLDGHAALLASNDPTRSLRRQS